jgi:DNA-binding transcriptional LysR family regulator
MTRPHLPALHLLSAFEAAARLKSFKAAAEELSITPSAVSQRIRKLENLLGTALFNRLNRAVALTLAGVAYLCEIRAAITAITNATERFVVAPGRVITLAMNSIVAHEMVIPQLARFSHWVQDAEVNIRTRPSMKTFRPEGPDRGAADAGIRICTGRWPGFEQRTIGALSLLPLCSRDLAPQICDWDDLQRQTLFCARSRREETLEAMRHPVTGQYHQFVVSFETLVEAVRAAEEGPGVMCGMMPIMANIVKKGRLAIAIDDERPAPEVLVFQVPSDHPDPERLGRVGDWIADCYHRLPALSSDDPTGEPASLADAGP